MTKQLITADSIYAELHSRDTIDITPAEEWTRMMRAAVIRRRWIFLAAALSPVAGWFIGGLIFLALENLFGFLVLLACISIPPVAIWFKAITSMGTVNGPALENAQRQLILMNGGKLVNPTRQMLGDLFAIKNLSDALAPGELDQGNVSGVIKYKGFPLWIYNINLVSDGRMTAPITNFAVDLGRSVPTLMYDSLQDHASNHFFDGSQLVQLEGPDNAPYQIFIAKGSGAESLSIFEPRFMETLITDPIKYDFYLYDHFLVVQPHKLNIAINISANVHVITEAVHAIDSILPRLNYQLRNKPRNTDGQKYTEKGDTKMLRSDSTRFIQTRGWSAKQVSLANKLLYGFYILALIGILLFALHTALNIP